MACCGGGKNSEKDNGFYQITTTTAEIEPAPKDISTPPKLSATLKRGEKSPEKRVPFDLETYKEKQKKKDEIFSKIKKQEKDRINNPFL